MNAILIRSSLAAVLVCGAVTGPRAAAQNLIPNPGFEDGTVAVCDQGILPDPWYQASDTDPGSDVSTFDCATLPGFTPALHYPDLAAAQGGLRFASAWNSADERFGIALTSTLVEGNLHHLSGYFTRSVIHSDDGVYDIYLSPDADYLDGTFVGSIGGTNALGTWSRDDLDFFAPAGAVNIIFNPRSAGTCYIGCDDWELVDLGPPNSPLTGNVNAGSGPVTDVLFVNGSAGDANRDVFVPTNTAIQVRLDAAPAGSDTGNYVVWAWVGPPTNPFVLDVGTSFLGTTANPTPFQPFASPQPFRCLRGGLPPQFCGSATEVRAPRSAPWSVLKGNGLPHPITLTIQGVLQDLGAASADQYSVTNGVVLHVQ
ncbi:MAG: hypothetical protein HYR85_12345 [Planctomycetes bacterium]|nr:hypothetical protein [Planctomycetota bacterium]